MASLRYIIDTMTTKEQRQSQAGINHMLGNILRENSRDRTVRAGENQKVELDIGDEDDSN